MRISKKYAGKSIGKHVFLSRIPSLLNRNGVNVPVSGGSNESLVRTTQQNLDKIRDLEFHFHMSLLQEGASCALGQNIGSRLATTSGSAAGLNITNGNGAQRHPSVLSSSNATGAIPMIFPSPHSNVSQRLITISFIVNNMTLKFSSLLSFLVPYKFDASSKCTSTQFNFKPVLTKYNLDNSTTCNDYLPMVHTINYKYSCPYCCNYFSTNYHFANARNVVQCFPTSSDVV